MNASSGKNGFSCASVFPARLVNILLLLSVATAVQAEVYDLPPPGNDVIGAITVVPARAEDTLLDIARRHGLGYEDIVRANPDVDTWLPGEGTEVVLPTRFVLPPGPRTGVILNLAEYRLYYYPKAKDGERAVVMTYPMSIGRMDWETPLGQTTVISKVTNPAWYPPASIRAEHAAAGDPLPRIVPAGPRNPLGRYAMRLGLPGYLIHGTNRPAGVGMRVTHGCVRMFPEDIRFLFRQIAVNTPVTIINEPVKLGWDGDLLVMEAHRVLDVAAPVPDPASLAAGGASEKVNKLAGDGTQTEGSESVSPPDEGQTELAAANEFEPLVREGQTELATVANEFEPLVREWNTGLTVADEFEPPLRDRMTILTEQFVAVTATRAGELDWQIAEALLDAAEGIPGPVGRAIKNAATSAASE